MRRTTATHACTTGHHGEDEIELAHAGLRMASHSKLPENGDCRQILIPLLLPVGG
jgi:hypothetical protein